MKKQKSVVETSVTKKETVRIPHWLVGIAEEQGNKSKAFIEMMIAGAEALHGIKEPQK